ncbi:conserved unknown protein [Ectocarpus siliculosus]|uniref:Mediator of RNA polymerase II transcription subunit 22 n=1 Tax=Ectocarpus siliculosus TaxID=2880 RepID=D7G7I1_ECTSI|nr:conserved unknown protein [Ectocarpus siliculosus]|eukprot:CBJ27723.1 conserved unknown protein [Ectocarpus siliculosus]
MSTAASRAGGSSSGATPAVNQRAVDFRRQLDAHTRTLVESFGGLVRLAKITNPQSTEREEFQVNVATASLATAGEGLLRQIRELKLAVMLQDEAAMDLEVDQALAKIASEREELEKELEALSNDLKGAYAKAAMAGGGDADSSSATVTGVEGVVSSFSGMDVVGERQGDAMGNAAEEEGDGVAR